MRRLIAEFYLTLIRSASRYYKIATKSFLSSLRSVRALSLPDVGLRLILTGGTMRIVFLGFGTWGVETLKAILNAGYHVPLVVTHPESNHEYESIWNESVLALASEHRISTAVCRYANDNKIVDLIAEANPDVIVSSDWRTWLSPTVFKLPPHGTINIHDALLPKYAGFAPINWAIANGETEAGVTVHFIQDDFDLGDIIIQRRVPIEFSDTATDLFYKTLPLFSSMALEALILIERGEVRSIRQERSAATFYHMRSERDGFIDWSKNSTEIYNLIRAQSDPYPNAYTLFNNKKLKVKRASLPDRHYCGTPGRVFRRLASGVVVVCGLGGSLNQGIVLEVVQEEGGPVIEANRYFKKMGNYLGR
jgi:methionyl-tRNA formyltransferase